MDNKNISFRQNCKDKLAGASKCLVEFFDIYAGIDAKLAQENKADVSFDGRQHLVAAIASAILLFFYVPILFYLGRFFEDAAADQSKYTISMAAKLIISSACLTLLCVSTILTMRFQTYAIQYTSMCSTVLMLGLCVLSPNDCVTLDNLQMKDSCTLTFKINTVLYLLGSVIIILLLSTKGVHMIMNGSINMVILIWGLIINTKEDTSNDTNYEVVGIIFCVICVAATGLLLAIFRLSWHANLKKSLISGSLYQDQAEKMLQIVHSIPCLAGGLILSEHIKVAEVDAIGQDDQEEQPTTVDKIFNGEKKSMSKRSTTKQKQRRVRVDYATDHIENVLFKGTAGTDLGNKIQKAANLIRSRKSNARGDGSAHHIDLKRVLKKSLLEPIALAQSQLTPAEKSNVITDLWQVLKKNCSRQASQELIETFYKILPSATQNKTEYKGQHKVHKKFEDKTPEQQKAETRKRKMNKSGHHGHHGVGRMGNQFLNPDAVKDDGGIVFKQNSDDSENESQGEQLIHEEQEENKEEEPDLPTVYLGVTQMKFISEYDGNEYLAVTVRRLLQKDLPGYLTGQVPQLVNQQKGGNTAKTFDEYKVKELAAMEYSRVPYFHQQKLDRDAPVKQPPTKIRGLQSKNAFLENEEPAEHIHRLSSEGQYENQVILTEKESSVLKLVTESLKEHQRYFHRVSLTLDEMLFKMNMDQPKSHKTKLKQNQFPYEAVEIASDPNPQFVTAEQQTNLRQVWNYAKLVLMRVQTLQSCIKVIQMKKAPNFTEGKTKSPDSLIRELLDLVQNSLSEKVVFNMGRGSSNIPKNMVIDWALYSQIIMSLLVGSLDNASFSEEINIEFKCQRNLNDPIEKKPGLVGKHNRGNLRGYLQSDKNLKVQADDKDLDDGFPYFCTIIFDNSPGRIKLLDSQRSDPFNESQYNPNVLVAEILATNMGGAVQVEQNEQYRILKVLLPRNGPAIYHQQKVDGTLEENLTQALIKLQFAAFNNFSLPLTALELPASSDDESTGHVGINSSQKSQMMQGHQGAEIQYQEVGEKLSGLKHQLIHQKSDYHSGRVAENDKNQVDPNGWSRSYSLSNNSCRRKFDQLSEQNLGSQMSGNNGRVAPRVHEEQKALSMKELGSRTMKKHSRSPRDESASKEENLTAKLIVPMPSSDSRKVSGKPSYNLSQKQPQVMIPQVEEQKREIESSCSLEMNSDELDEFEDGDGILPLIANIPEKSDMVNRHWFSENKGIQSHSDKVEDIFSDDILRGQKQSKGPFEIVRTSNRDYEHIKRQMSGKSGRSVSNQSDHEKGRSAERIISVSQEQALDGFAIIINSKDEVNVEENNKIAEFDHTQPPRNSSQQPTTPSKAATVGVREEVQPQHLKMKALDKKKIKEKPLCSVEEDSKEDQCSNANNTLMRDLSRSIPIKMSVENDLGELINSSKALKNSGPISEVKNLAKITSRNESLQSSELIKLPSLKDTVSQKIEPEQIVPVIQTIKQIERHKLMTLIASEFPPYLQKVLDFKADRQQKRPDQNQTISHDIALPKQPQKPTESKVFENKRNCTCKSTVLVVDDNQYNIMPVEMILKHNYNIDIDVAADGKSSIQMIKKNMTKACCNINYKMIFMDVLMPGMNGPQAAHEIQTFLKSHWKKHPPEYPGQTRHVPIFAMTAFVNKETVDKCRKAGMEGILYKPVSREGLMKQVSKFYNINGDGDEPKKINNSLSAGNSELPGVNYN